MHHRLLPGGFSYRHHLLAGRHQHVRGGDRQRHRSTSTRCTTPWNVKGASFIRRRRLVITSPPRRPNPQDVAFSADGTSMFVVGHDAGAHVYRYALILEFPITVISSDNRPAGLLLGLLLDGRRQTRNQRLSPARPLPCDGPPRPVAHPPTAGRCSSVRWSP